MIRERKFCKNDSVICNFIFNFFVLYFRSKMSFKDFKLHRLCPGSKVMDTSLIRKKIIEDDDEEELSVDLPGTAESTFCCGGGSHRSASKDQVSFLC